MKAIKELGYTVVDACSAVGVSRSRYYSAILAKPVKQRVITPDDAEILARIGRIKTEHPFWGYRRVRAWLVHREGISINRKRVYRLMREHGLLATQTVKRAKRTPQRSKPRADKPRQYWGIDMTKFMVPSVGWVYLVIVLDWYLKKVVGWNISLRSRTVEWKRALEMAVNREFPEGVRDQGLKLISDNGSQPTSRSFMRDMAILDIEQIFTSYYNPKGNADTERMMRTIKEEVVWLNEFSSVEEAKDMLDGWIEVDYNQLYPHSKLGYMSPEEFEAAYNRQIALKRAA